MESSNSLKSENPKLSPEAYIEKYKLESLLSEALNTIVSKKIKKPEAFMIKYLCTLLSNDEKQKHGIKDNSKEKVDKIPIVSLPNYFQNETIKNNLTHNFWEAKKYIKSSDYHSIMNLFDNPKEEKEELGIKIADSNCLEVYNDFLEPLFIEHFKLFLNHQPSYKLSDNKESISVEILKEFLEKKMLKFVRFEFRRNLKKYSNDLNNVSEFQADNIIKEVFEAVMKLNTYQEIQAKDCLLIKKNDKNFETCLQEYKVTLDKETCKKDKIIALIKFGDILIILNTDSNLRIMVCSKNILEENIINEFNSLYHEVKSFIKNLEKHLQFEYNHKFGYINQNPNFIGLSAAFFSEIYCPELVSENEFFNEFSNTFTLETQNKYAKIGKINRLNNESFTFELNSSLSQSEPDFLEEIFDKLYNIEFLVNSKSISQVNWTLENLNFDTLKNDAAMNNLLHDNFHLEKTYEKLYPKYKHIIYPNNLNLNTLIIQMINNNISNKSFSRFKAFFEHLFSNFTYNNSINSKTFKALKIPSADEPLVNTLNYNPFSYPFSSEEYRIKRSLYLEESFLKKFTKLFHKNPHDSKISQAIVNFSLKLHRNFQNYDLPYFLNDIDKIKISSIITEALEGRSEKIEIVNENLRLDKEFKIHINTTDHLIFEFSTDFQRIDSIDRISNFIKSFNQISLHAEYKKNKFAIINNVGYLVSDLTLLAFGLDFSVELDLNLLDEKVLEKEFSLFKNKHPISPIEIKKDEAVNTFRIKNDKKYENYFNYMSLQNMLEKVLELIGNLKLKNKEEEEIKESLKKEGEKIRIENFAASNDIPLKKNIDSENFSSPIDININSKNVMESEKIGIINNASTSENNMSYEGSSIHLNDSKVSDKGEEKYKNNFENSAYNFSGNGIEKKVVKNDEDDILIE